MVLGKGFLFLLTLFSGSGALFNGMTYENSERRRWLPIKSCKSKTEKYEEYKCGKAYDGIIGEGKDGLPSKNGYSLWGRNVGQWVEFTLRDVSKVNSVAIKSLWPGKEYRPKGFKIELYKDGSWIKPEEVRIPNSVVKAEVNGSEINMLEKRDDIWVMFKEVAGVSKVKLTFTSLYTSIVISEFFIQYVPKRQKCMTVGGTQRNRECIFPFVNKWTKAVHYGCTNDYGLPPWCATRVNNNWEMEGFQFSGFCDSSCEVEEPSTCYTMWSDVSQDVYGNEKTRERRNCVFPFQYNETWYTECTPEDMGGGKNLDICATTVDKNGTLIDKGVCGPECPGATAAAQCVSAVGWDGSHSNRCVFPYRFKGNFYTSCEDGDWPEYNGPLCATAIRYDNLEPVNDQWGYCGTESCDDKACITVGGAHVGQTCKFPFRNKWTKELHYGCTTASLEQEVGTKTDFAYASAPWCATETGAGDEMVKKKWGFCSKKCAVEDGNNCYVDDGTLMRNNKKCIFPFVFNGLVYKQCTYVEGYLKCPIKVDSDGLAKESDMRRCGLSKQCFNATTINGNPITIGYKDVGSYTNSGSKDMEISFSFETGVEDGSESNWNVEASVSVGFEAFEVAVEASVTAGGGGGSTRTSSNHMSHSLNYNCPPHTRVVLSQKVLSSGVFESRTFQLILSEMKITGNREAKTRELKWEEIAPQVVSRKLN